MTPEEIEKMKKYLESDAAGQAWFTEFSKGQGLVPEVIPEEDTPLTKLQKEFENYKKESSKKDILAQVSKAAAEKKLPMGIVELLTSDNIELTNSNIKTLEDIWTKSLKEGINTKVQPFTPTTGTTGGDVTKEAFVAMSYQDKKKLNTENPDLYNSLVN